MKKYVIIVAAGSGKRMLSKMPKQFLDLRDKPILFYSIEAFYKAFDDINVLLVISKNHHKHLEKLVKKHDFKLVFKLVDGGNNRFQSVKNALNQIKGNGLVAIHDGVRPFIKPKWVKKIFKKAGESGSAIPVLNTKESLLMSNNKSIQTAKRENFRATQTPQCFDISLIRSAYQQPYKKKFTDDATVLLSKNKTVSLLKGLEENIKITTPLDLEIAHQIINKKSSS